MAVNQANIFIALELLLKPIAKNSFIYGFLDAYGYSKATITRLQGNDNRNIAAHPEHGEVVARTEHQLILSCFLPKCIVSNP